MILTFFYHFMRLIFIIYKIILKYLKKNLFKKSLYDNS